jgi:hypothetical protein
MSSEMIAAALWTMLAFALLLSGIGIARRSFRLMMMSAVLTYIFGFAAILSIGIVLIVLAMLQTFLAFHFRRGQT